MSHRITFADRLALPLIAAPKLCVSGIELVSAACASGVIGSFPTPSHLRHASPSTNDGQSPPLSV